MYLPEISTKKLFRREVEGWAAETTAILVSIFVIVSVIGFGFWCLGRMRTGHENATRGRVRAARRDWGR